jgi:transposase
MVITNRTALSTSRRIVFRYRTGIAWHDLPVRFGPWQTGLEAASSLRYRWIWDKLLRVTQDDADASSRVDWNVSVDSSIVRLHRHSQHDLSKHQPRTMTIDEYRDAQPPPSPATSPEPRAPELVTRAFWNLQSNARSQPHSPPGQ